MPARRSKKKRTTKAPRAKERVLTEEPRGVEALTVLWMLSLMAAIMSQVAAGALALTLRFVVVEGDEPAALAALPGVLLFTALITGTLCLALLLPVLRIRAEPPPRGVIWTAALAGLSPWAVLVVLRLLEQA